MTDPRTMTTSALVRLVASGARNPEDQDAIERELDARVPTPDAHARPCYCAECRHTRNVNGWCEP